MYRLKDRNRFIPNGLVFYQPQTKWRSRPWAGFNQIVDEVIGHRTANPWLNASIDRATVEAEVDQFNANLCAQMGWGDYIVTVEGGAVPSAPFPVRRQSPGSLLQNVAAGSEALVEWIGSGAEAVSKVTSNQRAETCSKCPFNGRGGLERFFTLPVSNAIRAAYNQLRDWRLSTSFDDKLGVCEICSCPLPLKVHVPLNLIKKRIPEATFAALPDHCWMKRES